MQRVHIPCPHERPRRFDSETTMIVRCVFVNGVGSSFEMNPLCTQCSCNILVVSSPCCPLYYMELQYHMEHQLLQRVSLMYQTRCSYSEFVYRLQDNPIHCVCDTWAYYYGDREESEDLVIQHLERFPIIIPQQQQQQQQADDDDDTTTCCSICLEQLHFIHINNNNEDDVTAAVMGIRLPCHHEFHEQCLLPWLHSSLTCPLCRFTLS